MNRTLLAVLVSLLGASSVACTHEHTFSSITPTPAQLQRAGGRRVAIVMVDRLVSPRYETSTDGHTFIFNGAPVLIEKALEQALAGRVAAAQGFAGRAGAGFDVQLVPELAIEATGMLNHHCTVHYALSVLDGASRVIVRRQADADETFVPIANGPYACETALIAAFNSATYQALAALDTLP
jgi:hypothetical protein